MDFRDYNFDVNKRESLNRARSGHKFDTRRRARITWRAYELPVFVLERDVNDKIARRECLHRSVPNFERKIDVIW